MPVRNHNSGSRDEGSQSGQVVAQGSERHAIYAPIVKLRPYLAAAVLFGGAAAICTWSLTPHLGSRFRAEALIAVAATDTLRALSGLTNVSGIAVAWDSGSGTLAVQLENADSARAIAAAGAILENVVRSIPTIGHDSVGSVVRITRFSSTRVHTAMLALVIGAIFGSGLANVLFSADTRIRNVEEAVFVSGMRVFGAVAFFKVKGKPNRDDQERLDSDLSNLYGALQLELGQSDKSPVVTVTSPSGGEGKSFISSNLALAFTQHRSMKGLLVDADCLRGQLHRAFSTFRKPGLTDCLAGSVGFREVVSSTGYPGLNLTPCGTRMLEAPSLIASDAFPKFLEEARRSYDFVIIDTPPVLHAPFVRGVSLQSDSVVLVNRRGATQRQMLVRAAAELGTADVGFVLNAAEADKIYYGYLPVSEYEDRMPSKVIQV